MSATPTAHATAGGVHTITVNDQARTINGATTLAVVLADLGFAALKGTAAAVNGDVIARAAWADHVLRHGDRVLVIRATQGG